MGHSRRIGGEASNENDSCRDGFHWRSSQRRYRLEPRAPRWKYHRLRAQNVDLEGKRLELLKDFLPHLSRVGMLANAGNPLFDISLQKLRPAAEQLRVAVDVFDVHSSGGIEAALLGLDRTRPDGVLGSELINFSSLTIRS